MNFPTNQALLMNVGNLGYPSIINNNIQGLSINYSNNIIQQAPIQGPQTGQNSKIQPHDQSSYPTF